MKYFKLILIIFLGWRQFSEAYDEYGSYSLDYLCLAIARQPFEKNSCQVKNKFQLHERKLNNILALVWTMYQ